MYSTVINRRAIDSQSTESVLIRLKEETFKDSFITTMDRVYENLLSIQKSIKFYPNFIDLQVGGYTCTAKNFNKYTIGCDGSVHKCDESLENSIGYLNENGELEINKYEHANWVHMIYKDECRNCFFSCSCFQELCPKSRVLFNNTNCPVNFNEIDALIRLAAYTYMVEQI